jgi:HAD superfamily hydrolase (TIGR01509 family)
MKAKAIIFDFDGVIADTEPLHYRAFQEVLEPIGLEYSWKEYLDLYAGFDDRDALRERFKRSKKQLPADELARLAALKAQAFERLVTRGAAKPYPGVVELVRAQEGVRPVALCSGAVRSDILPVLRSLALTEAFQVVVTAEDVATSKPDPACYRLAVERLGGLRPAECLAIEDTPAGIQAAKAAGLRVVAVTNTYGREKLFGADRIVASLAGLKV